ncbi:DUF732 domain-containing protein [Actinoplanes sp. NPDC020271]|uniref:DUF732 domain-containing protein n=1 Tax=Actinoplanes sp. NPDC020271 TaxID=3363896 RepID=UPI003796B82C
MSRKLVIAVAAFAVCLTGCSSGASSTVAPAAQNSAAVPSQPDLRASMEAQLGFPPKPDATTTRAYLADLKSIDPGLVSTQDAEALVNRGRDQCRDLKARPEKEWVTVASQRFSTQPADATKIIKVVRTRLCPQF